MTLSNVKYSLKSILRKILLTHPILLGFFFIIYRYGGNLGDLDIFDLLYVSAIFIPIFIIFSIIVKLIIKDTTKSLLISSLMIGLFFLYTSIHLTLYKFEIGGIAIGKHIILFPVISISTLLVIILLTKSKKNYEPFLKISYFVVLILVAYNIAEIGFNSNSFSYVPENNLIQPFSINESNYRDVYHLILDEYSGTASLQKYLNYDNSDFDNSLKQIGFFIPEKSFSNYADTKKTIPSILNMNYIHDLIEGPTQSITHREMTKNNLITKIFEDNGYEIITFHNEMMHLQPDNNPSNILCKNNAGNVHFLSFLILTTPVEIFKNWIDLRNYPISAENRLCIFDELSTLDKQFSHPMYVYAHIKLPHEPFIFDSNGNLNPYTYEGLLSEDEINSLYISQTQYTNSLVLQLVSELLSQEPQPIIIIQSDHGYRAGYSSNEAIEQSFSNFVAYYFPNVELNNETYQTMTTVNTYRILLNHNFGTNYELLENRMYITTTQEPKDITNILISMD